ncbi:MAG: hypothetical protein H6599_05525 [Flavobacteriales bacterium]|nr:hypothetical protein [Flavobacteriales bacterium]
MKILVIIIAFLSLVNLKAQELFTVTGKTQIVSYHQGGVELPPFMMEPKALPNTMLYVVQYYGPNEKSVVVASFKSDINGNYEVKLPAGTYGFVQNKYEAGIGIYLPGMKETTEVKNDSLFVDEIRFEEIGYEDYRSLDHYEPFEVLNKDVEQINITHYQISICYTCP